MGAKEMISHCLMGTESQLCKMKRIMEMDGDDCHILRMYLLLLKMNLKMVEMIKSM